MTGIDIPKILALAPSPAYVIDLGRLRHNLATLDQVQKRSGAKILMALKAFAMWSTFPLIRETLQGVCASSPWEARLGREGREGKPVGTLFVVGDPKQSIYRFRRADIDIYHRVREGDTWQTLADRYLGSPLRGRAIEVKVRLGDNVKVGINASIQPGTIISEDCLVGAGTTVGGTVSPGSRIY